MGLSDLSLGERHGAIKKYFGIFYRAIILPKSANEDEARKEYIINIILVACIMMLTILDGMILLHLFTQGDGYSGVSLTGFSGFLIFFILLYVLSRRGYHTISAYLIIAILFAGNSYAVCRWGVDLPITLLAYAFIIAASGIVIGNIFGIAMTISTAITLVVIWHLHTSGIIIPHTQYPTEDDIIVLTVFYFLIMAISWLSNREIEKSLSRARRSEDALKIERDLLEMRVIERTNELRKVQFEELERVHRFAEFGKSASGLFHDLLNLLNAISLRTEGNTAEETSLAAAYSTTREIRQFMRGIQKQLDEKNSEESFSLVEGIEQAIRLITHKAHKESVRIIFLHSDKPPFIYRGIPFKFHQIIINLVGNAIDAYSSIPKNNSTVRTVTIRLKISENCFVLAIEDKGCGIPATAQQMIFKPFFTTKKDTHGSGIGLASTKKMIEQDFRGTISVESIESAGTVFTVQFPINHDDYPEHSTEEDSSQDHTKRPSTH